MTNKTLFKEYNRMKSIREEQEIGTAFVARMLEITESEYLNYENSKIEDVPFAIKHNFAKMMGIDMRTLNSLDRYVNTRQAEALAESYPDLAGEILREMFTGKNLWTYRDVNNFIQKYEK